MANILKPKRSGVASAVPTTANLSDGELAINSADKAIYLRVGIAIVEIARFFSGAFPDLSGKPTTIAGYGITDAPTKTGAGAAGTWPINISGGAGGAPVSSITTTSYILALADANQFKDCENASPQSVTIPPQSSVTWPDNAQTELMQRGAGAVTIVAGAGVTVRVAPGLTAVSAGQFSVFGIKRLAADEWVVFGHLVPS